MSDVCIAYIENKFYCFPDKWVTMFMAPVVILCATYEP